MRRKPEMRAKRPTMARLKVALLPKAFILSVRNEGVLPVYSALDPCGDQESLATLAWPGKLM